jgi:proteasome assembly chaperone (PAC2) family protein
MEVDEVLTWTSHPVLNRPIMVVALKGFFDAAEVATGALSWLRNARLIETVAEIDGDPFYDFTQERPLVQLDDRGERTVLWPTNTIEALRFPGTAHDLVLVDGTEPHIRWRTFADSIVIAAQELRCEAVVTLGAGAEPVPHTRAPMVTGSTTEDDLASSLGLQRPQYQGITGLIGVLLERLEREDVPSISLRVGVPHYLTNAKHPAASAALLSHLEHVVGVPTNVAAMQGDVNRWRDMHDAAVEADDQARLFVRMLEAEYDRRVERTIPTADDLAEQFERFLDERRDDDPS